MRVHLVNPSDVSFGIAIITPRWLYVLAGATPTKWGDPILTDETLEAFDSPPITFGDPARSGDLVLEATGIAKSFEETLFADLDLRVERGQRLGVLQE